MPDGNGRARWQRAYDHAAKRDADFTTISGLAVEPVYGPPAGELPESVGWPGEFPFTRGLYATGYRGKPWTIRQFSGFGNVRQTNERYKMLLRAGGAGLSVAFDLPTLMGRDSDDPRSLGEVGHCGVAIDSAADMDVLFDFFEEIAKFRAARRIWARWLRDVYGAKTARAQWLRFHTQTAGVSLTAQQPVNNVVRTAVEALAAVLGGTNSLHTNALDEVLALPSTAAAETALRTQQVLAEETGVGNVADPLGGSWYVEALTDRLDAAAEETFARIRAMSPDGSMTAGILHGIESGWFTGEIADAASEYQQKLEEGDKRIVGVTSHTGTVGGVLETLRISPEVERAQVAELAARRAARDQATVERTLADLVTAARTDANLVEPMLAAARAEATLGETCEALRSVWGSYTEPPAF